jgi:hypothetical protein
MLSSLTAAGVRDQDCSSMNVASGSALDKTAVPGLERLRCPAFMSGVEKTLDV